MRNQLDIFDHDPARMAATNRAAAERALTDVQSRHPSARNATSTTWAKPNARNTSPRTARVLSSDTRPNSREQDPTHPTTLYDLADASTTLKAKGAISIRVNSCE